MFLTSVIIVAISLVTDVRAAESFLVLGAGTDSSTTKCGTAANPVIAAQPNDGDLLLPTFGNVVTGQTWLQSKYCVLGSASSQPWTNVGEFSNQAQCNTACQGYTYAIQIPNYICWCTNNSDGELFTCPTNPLPTDTYDVWYELQTFAGPVTMFGSQVVFTFSVTNYGQTLQAPAITPSGCTLNLEYSSIYQSGANTCTFSAYLPYDNAACWVDAVGLNPIPGAASSASTQYASGHVNVIANNSTLTVSDTFPFDVAFPFSAAAQTTSANLDTLVTIALRTQTFTDTTQSQASASAASGTLVLSFSVTIDGTGYVVNSFIDQNSNTYSLSSGWWVSPTYTGVSCTQTTWYTVTANICPGPLDNNHPNSCSGGSVTSSVSITIQVAPDISSPTCEVVATISLTDLTSVVADSSTSPTGYPTTSASTLHIGNFWSVGVSSATVAKIGMYLEITSVRLSYPGTGSNMVYVDLPSACWAYHKYTAIGQTWFAFLAEQDGSAWTTAASPAAAATFLPNFLSTPQACPYIPMQIHQQITMTIGVQVSDTLPAQRRRDASGVSSNPSAYITVPITIADSSNQANQTSQATDLKSGAAFHGFDIANLVAGAVAVGLGVNL
ncbi:hypothetical protein HK100_001760 [Physocladia obscura]|uniref:WSC domain-containing protein n=1 Tax=Physocladia obscura TaxID=109957 RepID=A0AAD5SYW4_9FUNG|nr:hypothetical protein HK100_001760 [Physocladia obscura]